MDPQLAKYVMLGAVFFGAFVIVPIVMALISHQQKMTELLNRTSADADSLRTLLERVEQKLDAIGRAPALDAGKTEQPQVPPHIAARG